MSGLDLPDSQMLIMLALADWANDDGVAWPSIAKLAAKTRKSERTVQNAIKAMCDDGHMHREEIPGVGVRYYLHPRNDCTPAESAPPQNLHPRKDCTPPRNGCGDPAASAPNTSKKHHRYITPIAPQRGNA
jgi:hypothetical protein